MSLAKLAVSGIKWNAVAIGGRAVIQVITLAILARLLNPADFGLVGMAAVITGFIYTFEDLGLANAIIKKRDSTREQLASVFWFNLIFGWSLFGLIWIATPLAVLFYHEPALSMILPWAAADFLMTPFSSQFQGLLRRDLRFKDRTIILLSNLILYSIVSIYLAWMGYGAMSLVLGTLSGTFITVIMSVYVAYRSRWLPMLHFYWNDLAEYIKFGLFQSGGRVLEYISNNVDYLIIGSLLGPTALGYYTLAYNLMRLPLGYINPLVNTVAFPVFARVQNDVDLLRKGYTRLLRYLSIASIPLMAGMFSVANLLIPVVYGSQWLPSIPIVQIFAGLGILFSLNDPLESILLAKGRPDLLLYLSGGTILVYGIGNWIGSHWGISGVAVSSLLVALIALAPIQISLIRRFAGLSILQMWLATKPAFIASLIMVLAVVGLSYLLPPVLNVVVQLLILVVTGCIVYGLSLFAFDRQIFGLILKDFGLDRYLVRFHSHI